MDIDTEMVKRNYPQHHIDAISEWFSAHSAHEYDDQDCHRVARADDRAELDRYYASVGCCGSVDEEIIVDQVTYLVGFNYGH
jgi:hypothetical protein